MNKYIRAVSLTPQSYNPVIASGQYKLLVAIVIYS